LFLIFPQCTFVSLADSVRFFCIDKNGTLLRWELQPARAWIEFVELLTTSTAHQQWHMTAPAKIPLDCRLSTAVGPIAISERSRVLVFATDDAGRLVMFENEDDRVEPVVQTIVEAIPMVTITHVSVEAVEGNKLLLCVLRQGSGSQIGHLQVCSISVDREESLHVVGSLEGFFGSLTTVNLPDENRVAIFLRGTRAILTLLIRHSGSHDNIIYCSSYNSSTSSLAPSRVLAIVTDDGLMSVCTGEIRAVADLSGASPLVLFAQITHPSLFDAHVPPPCRALFASRPLDASLSHWSTWTQISLTNTEGTPEAAPDLATVYYTSRGAPFCGYYYGCL
jgi:hypothetical protein